MTDADFAPEQSGVGQALEPGASPADDQDLGAVWDRMERDNGAARAEDGKFAGAEDERAGDDPAGAKGATEAAPASQPSGTALPPNLQILKDDWATIPETVRAKMAARENEIHARMSDQGRALGEFRPFADVLAQYRDLFDGRQLPNGEPATPASAAAALFEAQRRMEADPVSTLIQIADMYGARQYLAQALGQNLVAQAPALTRADAERMFREMRDEDTRTREGDALLGRLSKDKPLFGEIPEETMVFFVNQAWEKLGGTASPEAVFDRAYDMAVNADPDLRAKATAAAPAPAVKPKPTDVQGARRAASVNLNSTSSGRGRALTDEEELAAIYDKNQR